MRSQTFRILAEAQDLVRDRGDEGWFCEYYHRSREWDTIAGSVYRALDAQSLWSEFCDSQPHDVQDFLREVAACRC